MISVATARALNFVCPAACPLLIYEILAIWNVLHEYITRRCDVTYHRSTHGASLSANSDGVAHVLDVDAGDILAFLRQEACTDAEFRVRA